MEIVATASEPRSLARAFPANKNVVKFYDLSAEIYYYHFEKV